MLVSVWNHEAIGLLFHRISLTMKKKSRPPRQVSQEKEGSCRGTRGRPRKYGNTDRLHSSTMDKSGEKLDPKITDDFQNRVEGSLKPTGRLPTSVCRLCHGRFSPRSLCHVFEKSPQGTLEAAGDESEAASPLLFHSDFQRLVGVPLDRDPHLSEFICKKCHANFYKCHSILIRFLQKVNLPPAGQQTSKIQRNTKCPESVDHSSAVSPSLTSDPKCLHSLVSWAHHHAEACRSCPDLKEVLEGQCWGSVKAVWGCVQGHQYVMDSQYTSTPNITTNCNKGEMERVTREEGVPEENEEEQQEEVEPEQLSARSQNRFDLQSLPKVTSQTSTLENWNRNAEDETGQEETLLPSPSQQENQTADSDLSDRVSEEDFDDNRRGGLLDEEELFEPYLDNKRAPRVNVPNKKRLSPKDPEEPKIKKKPGPKPGWKNKIKPKGEELPNIYKCPYQGCTAVYRAPDGLKKHRKEHHEEVRERPCPHPGCKKVFLIDRYLQRHVKLIHTEERNYICDQCGQTFKQRKHLSVHQMRHSGAKPLQCEVCGFQCRQRASLKYHMTKHKAEADLEFECLICRKRFEKAHNLNVHMSMVHPLTQTEIHRSADQ